MQVAPVLLEHTSASVRAAAVDFVAAAAGFLSPPDVYAHLMPMVLPALTAEPASLSSQVCIPVHLTVVTRRLTALCRRHICAISLQVWHLRCVLLALYIIKALHRHWHTQCTHAN